MLISSYFKKNINIQIFVRYFNYFNDYQNYYSRLDNNYEYPSISEAIF